MINREEEDKGREAIKKENEGEIKRAFQSKKKRERESQNPILVVWLNKKGTLCKEQKEWKIANKEQNEKVIKKKQV